MSDLLRGSLTALSSIPSDRSPRAQQEFCHALIQFARHKMPYDKKPNVIVQRTRAGETSDFSSIVAASCEEMIGHNHEKLNKKAVILVQYYFDHSYQLRTRMT